MEKILALFSLTTVDGVMILVGMIAFFVLFTTLKVCLFDPFIKLAETRESLTSGAAARASAQNEKADEILGRVEEQLREVRRQAVSAKLEKLAVAHQEAAKLTGDAEKRVSDEVKSKRAELRQELDDLRAKALTTVDDLARTLVDRLSRPAA